MKLVYMEDVLDALVEKGQASERYRLGEMWELNGGEIRSALESVHDISPDILHDNELLQKEIQFWREKAKAYETAIVILAKRIKDDTSA